MVIQKVYVNPIADTSSLENAVSNAINTIDFKTVKKVLIKPNFVCPRHSNTGATTDLTIIELVIKALVAKNMEVTVGEGAGFEFDTDTVFKILGADKLTKRYNASLVNLRKAETRSVNIGGNALKKVRLPIPVLDTDIIINLPKFKTHMLTGMTFAMKNFIGVLPEEERRKAHMRGINQPVVDLVNFFAPKNVLTIGDAIITMGGLGGPGYGQAIPANMIISGRDNIAVDIVAFGLFSVNTDKIGYLQIAKKNLPFSDIDVIGSHNNFPKEFPVPDSGSAYKLSYRLMHTCDYLTSPLHKKSLIPRIASKIGTRPVITNTCNRCRKCINICPVQAISDNYEINFNKCRYVKCLTCLENCPKQAIKTKGFLFSK